MFHRCCCGEESSKPPTRGDEGEGWDVAMGAPFSEGQDPGALHCNVSAQGRSGAPGEFQPLEPATVVEGARSIEFSVTIEKREEEGAAMQQLGLQLARRKVGLAIVSFMGPGMLVREWNAQNPDRQLQHGDVITRANDREASCSTPDEMLDEIRDSSKLELSILRATQFCMTVRSLAGALGLDVSEKDCTVIGLSKGPIQEHNRSCEGQFMVTHGDILVEVNGKKGSALELLAEIQATSGPLKLFFKRPGVA